MRRIYHPYWKWECLKAGFFDTNKELDKEQCMKAYANFLSNDKLFRKAIERVFSEWPISCEQFLSNRNINRIAWIGQSSMCIEKKVSSLYCGGFRLLDIDKQKKANKTAKEYLTMWINNHERKDTQIYFKW